ncbi:MAG: hypothetical protein SGI72_06665 [Planctomycetota bacterium]|nr:hypothetical protein [Planctomycetota bacterium]
MTRSRFLSPHVLLVALACAILVRAFSAFAYTPFISEDWTHLEEMRTVPSFFAALDPRVEPLRPFQHAFFWVLGHCGADPAGVGLPFVAHLCAFAMHAAACVLVYFLARAAGARSIGAYVAVFVFAAFPNVKAFAWSAAIGNPGRVCFELAALLVLVRQLDAPSASRGIGAIVLFALALAWHEAAMILPAILVLWIVCLRAETLRDGLTQLRNALRDPWLVAFFAASVAYVLYLFLRPSRHHQAKSFDALPANVVKASTALLPEDLRVLIVEGFRAHGGTAFVVAGIVSALLAAGAMYLAWRSRTARFVLFACAIELGLPALGTGFVQRYAYCASALVAIGLGMWISKRGTIAVWIAVLALTSLWAKDLLVDAGDFRALGRRIPAWIEEVREVREKTAANVPIAIVNPPDMFGAERDIPLFNWGLDYMLDAHRVGGPKLFWRTRDFHTSTNVERVDPARVDEARRTGIPRVYEFDMSPLR